MNFAKSFKTANLVAAFAAAGTVAVSAYAASDNAPVSASFSPVTQLDWDAAHRDANAYANAKKAPADGRVLAKSSRVDSEVKNDDAAQVAQAQNKEAAPKASK